MENQEQPQNRSLFNYTNELSENLLKVLRDCSILVSRNRIYIYKVGDTSPDLKKWLYDILESLPDILHPLETVEFVVYENGEMNLITKINPSEFDVRAVEYAIASDFRGQHPETNYTKEEYSREPLPLDHPWYSDKEYFNKLPKTKQEQLFNKIKDMPNVKPLLDDMKKKGLIPEDI